MARIARDREDLGAGSRRRWRRRPARCISRRPHRRSRPPSSREFRFAAAAKRSVLRGSPGHAGSPGTGTDSASRMRRARSNHAQASKIALFTSGGPGGCGAEPATAAGCAVWPERGIPELDERRNRLRHDGRYGEPEAPVARNQEQVRGRRCRRRPGASGKARLRSRLFIHDPDALGDTQCDSGTLAYT